MDKVDETEEILKQEKWGDKDSEKVLKIVGNFD